MATNDQLHASPEVLERASATAETLSTSIDGHRASLQPVVAGMRAGWDGLAPPMFEAAHANWEAGIVRLVTALRELGDNTRVTSVQYAQTDQDVSTNLGAVQNMGAFGGQLSTA